MQSTTASNRQWSRREILKSSSCGFGLLALAGLSHESILQQASAEEVNPLMPKQPHFPCKAKHIIFLHMRGGPAHMDTFEYKPRLEKDDNKSVNSKNRKILASPWKFRTRGESGLRISDLVPHMAEHADDLCLLNGMHTDVPNHTPAMVHLHTGSFQFTRPSLGSWLLYGLGTENQNLPGFITISPPIINGGPKNYGSAFLPAVYQGTPIGDIKTPVKSAQIRNLKNKNLSVKKQREQLNLIQSLNRDFAAQDPQDSQLEGIINSYELAFRMQSELPEVMDLSQESKATLDMYGIDENSTDNFGRQCLLARRFVEAGVRYIELCDEFWDQHNSLKSGHSARAKATDQPIGALLTDLKQRGLLNETLILWGGEFGRTPDSTKRDGRDHNAKGYTMWLAGGGVKGGMAYGSTDDHGYEAVDGKVHTHDLHATLLHLMGLNHKELTYQYAGRNFRLTNVSGNVIEEIVS